MILIKPLRNCTFSKKSNGYFCSYEKYQSSYYNKIIVCALQSVKHLLATNTQWAKIKCTSKFYNQAKKNQQFYQNKQRKIYFFKFYFFKLNKQIEIKDNLVFIITILIKMNYIFLKIKSYYINFILNVVSVGPMHDPNFILNFGDLVDYS